MQQYQVYKIDPIELNSALIELGFKRKLNDSALDVMRFFFIENKDTFEFDQNLLAIRFHTKNPVFYFHLCSGTAQNLVVSTIETLEQYNTSHLKTSEFQVAELATNKHSQFNTLVKAIIQCESSKVNKNILYDVINNPSTNSMKVPQLVKNIKEVEVYKVDASLLKTYLKQLNKDLSLSDHAINKLRFCIMDYSSLCRIWDTTHRELNLICLNGNFTCILYSNPITSFLIFDEDTLNAQRNNPKGIYSFKKDIPLDEKNTNFSAFVEELVSNENFLKIIKNLEFSCFKLNVVDNEPGFNKRKLKDEAKEKVIQKLHKAGFKAEDFNRFHDAFEISELLKKENFPFVTTEKQGSSKKELTYNSFSTSHFFSTAVQTPKKDPSKSTSPDDSSKPTGSLAYILNNPKK